MAACNCKNERIIPDVNTPVGSKHLLGCPQLKSYMFYWEEAASAQVPASDDIDSIISTDNQDQGEELEIKFKRFDMTEDEYKSIPIDQILI